MLVPCPRRSSAATLFEDFGVLLARVASGADDKGFLVTGLRGVGKTVLLNRFKTMAEQAGAVVVSHEIVRIGTPFPMRFAALCRRALYEISPRERWKQRAVEAARVIKSFSIKVDPDGTLGVGFDVDAATGMADSGDLSLDLTDVVVALGQAADEHCTSIVFLLDEIQYLNSDELSALVIAKHQINQQRLPIVFSGAGLPQLPALTGEAQTYAERMFSFPEIGALNLVEATAALLKPAEELGVSFTPEAVSHIIQYTEGYPFFIQEFGKAVWNEAAPPTITLADAQVAERQVEEVLDQDFFAVRTDPLPDSERAYVKALASLGPGEHTPAQIANAMGKKSSSAIGSTATRLIERGLVYRSRRGQVAFTVPHFDRYVMRTFP
jgi:hypothetical protein